jgi:DNA polymerase-3 subunit gamma/tau
VRELVVQKVTDGDAGHLSELSPEEREQAIAIAKDVELLEVQRAFSSLAQLVEDVGRSAAPRTVLEMGLVRLATRPPLRQVTELLARLDAIEKRLDGGPTGGGGRRPAPSGPSQRTEGARGGRFAEARPATDGPRTADHVRVTDLATPAATPDFGARTTDRGPQASAEDRGPRASIVTEVAPGDPLPVWERIIARIAEARPALAAILEHGVPLSITREKVVVGFPPSSFFGKQAETADSKEGIAESAAHVIGHRPAVEVRFTEAADAGARTVAQVAEKRREDVREERRREALSHPRVQEALQVFPEGAGNVQVHVINDGADER